MKRRARNRAGHPKARVLFHDRSPVTVLDGVIELEYSRFLDRFWAKVLVGDGCWLWTGGKGPRGEGRIGCFGQVRAAHRVAYEEEYGPIPWGFVVRHHCHNPSCVRPDHLIAMPRAGSHPKPGSLGRAKGKPRGLAAECYAEADGDAWEALGLAVDKAFLRQVASLG